MWRPQLITYTSWVVVVYLAGLSSGQFRDEKPVITEGPSDVVVSRGKPTEMKCSVYGSPFPTIQWYKDNVLLDVSESRFSVDRGTLSIAKVKRSSRRSDEGVYYCVATNRVGKATSNNATLTVTYLSKRFNEQPANVSSVLDGLARFHCIPPDGHPQAAVSWLLNGQLLPGDSRFKRSISNGRHELKIEPVQLQDNGIYICQASNTAERRESTPAYLYIRAKPTAAILPQSSKVYEGRNVEFTCRVTGVPPPSIKWTKDGKELQLSARLRLLSDTSLAVQNAQLVDNGVYKCSVANREGSADSTATLTVLRRPEFITRPTHLSVGVGQTAKLECEVRGEPGLTLFWQKLIGATFVETLIFPLQPYDGRLLVSSNGLLTITNVQKKDAAVYICTVNSGPVTISASAKLTVLENSTPPPVVSLTPGNHTVPEETNITLTCAVSGTPEPTVAWEYGSNNQKITDGSGGIRLMTNGTRHLLVFTNIKRSSSGSYRCIASNAGGTTAKLAYLDVKLLPKPPSPPDNVRIANVTDSSLTLMWDPAVSAPSTPVTSYDIEFLNVDSRTKWQVLVKSVQASKFTVVGLMPNTRYRFSVRGINKIGESLRSAPSVIVSTLPKPTSPPTPAATPSIPTKVDKLLDLRLELSLFPYNRDSLQLSWKPVKPANRIQGFYLYWRQVGANKFKRLDLFGNHISTYILTKLQRDTAYDVKIQAFNDKYTSPMSDTVTLKTTPYIPFPPPEEVLVAQGGEGQILVTWKAPWKTIVAHDVLGYLVKCVSTTNIPIAEISVPKNITSFVVTNLVPSEEYIITVAVRTSGGTGIASAKKTIKLAAPTNGSGIVMPGSLPPPPYDPNRYQPSSFIRTVKSTWFIATVGGILWLLLLIIVIFIVCWRRKRSKRKGRSSMFNEQAKSLLTGSKTLNGETNVMQSGLIYTDHSAFWSSTHAPEDGTLTGGNRSLKSGGKAVNYDGTMNNDINDKVYFKPSAAPGESYEMKTTESFHPVKPTANGSSQNDGKTSLPRFKNAGAESWKEAARKAPADLMPSHCPSKSRSDTMNSQDRPRLKIQGAFDPSQMSGDESSHTAERRGGRLSRDEPVKQNTAERHAEIKRTRTAPKSEPSDGHLTTGSADTKADDRSDLEPPPSYDTLRRKAKSPFKPVPKLTLLNWADVLPGPPSKPPSSMGGSPPDSPKLMSCGASAVSENIGRTPSRMSHGSNGSVHRYPYGNANSRSHRAPSVSSRRSSMMSSELYQSEMDPSVQSDIYSDRKKNRSKAVPPPIELEGMTSDILMQWADSVTNSSPSSSGSSSPSRLSAVSSTGSFFNDEEFAQAVAAVAECGGFNMDMDYSLSGCGGGAGASGVPSLTKDKLNRLEQSRHRMDRVDAMIASGARFTRPVAPGSLSNGNRQRVDPSSPSPVPPISLSNYLLGPSKRNGPSSVASENQHASRPKLRPSKPHSVDNANPIFDSASVSSAPLTTSNLRDHEISIDSTKQATPPLTVNNLKHHESSLERQSKHPPTVAPRPSNGDSRQPKRTGKRSPPSTKSSLERGASNGHSQRKPLSATNSAERRSKRKQFVNLMDPNSSTSTASTVRTTPDQMDC